MLLITSTLKNTLKRVLQFNPKSLHHTTSTYFPPIIVNVLIAIMIVACGQMSTTDNVDRLHVVAPQATIRGNALEIVVQADYLDDEARIGLVMIGVLGPRVYRSQVVEGVAIFNIPPEHTQFLGYVALIATAGEVHGETSLILINDESA